MLRGEVAHAIGVGALYGDRASDPQPVHAGTWAFASRGVVVTFDVGTLYLDGGDVRVDQGDRVRGPPAHAWRETGSLRGDELDAAAREAATAAFQRLGLPNPTFMDLGHESAKICS